MERKNIKIFLVAIIVILIGVELLREQIQNIIVSNEKPSLLQISLEAAIPVFFIVIGISFAFMKKWAMYLVRTSLLLIIMFGFLITIFAIFVGFIGLPSFLLYLMILAAGVSLTLIGRAEVKERFGIKK